MSGGGAGAAGDGGPSLRRGVRVGVDVGSVRVGVARCDPDGILATPVRTVARRPDGGDVAEIAALVAELGALEVLVGLPRSLSGQEGRSAAAARAYAVRVAAAVGPTPVRLVDERLTTVSAHQALHRAGRPGRRHRAVVDQVAAVMIVEQALEVERRTGAAAGELVVPAEGEPAAQNEPSAPATATGDTPAHAPPARPAPPPTTRGTE
ncbi:Holliday junction resolvase RuvX [Georgenia sp. TF02-10]|uniref:Holliday junction resolvase RuvX n=1 Tax=Georgenia sp. TF02-10 TaxID=2917725 RepID=UPI001FA6BAD3|nr:Holliday junction resolvase RuvX [Georgenia sp. TF02-10]UNX53246.1 Holliday junction resolvase RuvX [Georgenia sp. TF02-10]